MIETSVAILKESRGLIKKMIGQAAAAEDLPVAQFQGLVEVIQNADDVRATEVRFALRETKTGRQLLIVHNVEPVTCHNVLAMALPFLTTKTERRDQRGRFGIGLKTLKRIATSVAIHSAPYHFSGDQLHFDWVEPESALPGLYDPQTDTLLVLTLRDDFDEVELKDWFDAWEDDGLLFLASVSSFRWCDLSGATIIERTLEFKPWIDAGYANLHEGVLALMTRRVLGPKDSWTVWRATVKVSAHLHPAHKARSETTDISVAIADSDSEPTLYIGFKTPVAVSLPFSLDAQFDPTTSREAIIQNPWNNWLIDRSAEVAGDIAAGLLASDPVRAWPLIPLGSEGIGLDDGSWMHRKFGSAFGSMRAGLANSGALALGGRASLYLIWPNSARTPACHDRWAGRVVSLMSWVFLFSLPLGGYLATRFRAPNVVMFTGLSGTVVVGALIPFTDAPFATFTLFGILYAASAPVVASLPAQVLRPETRGPGLGICYIWVFVGSAFLPIVGERRRLGVDAGLAEADDRVRAPGDHPHADRVATVRRVGASIPKAAKVASTAPSNAVIRCGGHAAAPAGGCRSAAGWTARAA